jgi:group I intron endonuclease
VAGGVCGVVSLNYFITKLNKCGNFQKIWQFFPKLKMGYIYKITNRVSGKIYIGKTIQHDYELRWKEHKYMCRQEKGGCPALRDAVRKYGIDAFMFEVLIICFDEECDRWEREYIKKYDCIAPNGYNILEGGQGGAGFRGKTHSAETIKRIVEATKKYSSNPEYKEMVRARTRDYYDNKIDRKEHGKKVVESEKYKAALEEGRVGGRGHTNDGTLRADTKDKIRKSVLKYYEEIGEGDCNGIEKHRKAMAKASGKRIDKYTKDGKFIQTYVSISEAARNVNICKTSIMQALKGATKSSAGFVWKYHIDEHEPKMENEIIYGS